MIIEWGKYHREKLLEAAMEMAIAARTAPKGRGRDLLTLLILNGEEKDAVADRMEGIGRREGVDFFLRDAESLRQAPVLLLLGTASEPLDLAPCGYCGCADCGENRRKGDRPCAFALGDLGIAIGSAAALAADKRIDNRVMFSAGRAALELGLFPPETVASYGLPLSATGKNPFFDRKREKGSQADRPSPDG